MDKIEKDWLIEELEKYFDDIPNGLIEVILKQMNISYKLGQKELLEKIKFETLQFRGYTDELRYSANDVLNILKKFTDN